MQFEYIDYQTNNRVASIILNRPDKRNAFNEGLVSELKRALEIAELDSDVKVILLKANGNIFSAGADLAYLQKMQQHDEQQNYEDSKSLADLFAYIYKHPKIIVSQVEGHAIAGGCGLVTLCDFTFAVPEALFGYTEVKIGFIPAIVMVFLIRKIGECKAKELLLSGRLIGAYEAEKIGIISRVVPNDKIDLEVSNFIQNLCVNCSDTSLKLTKSMIAEVQNMTLDNALDYAAKINAFSRTTDDCKRGIASFIKKEKINW